MYEIKDREPNFEEYAVKTIQDSVSIKGLSNIVAEIDKQRRKSDKKTLVITFDYYHGVNEQLLFDEVIQKLYPDMLIDAMDAKLPEEIIAEKFHHFITDDRTNGVFSWGSIDEFFDEEKVKQFREKIEHGHGLVIVYGVAASIIHKGDLRVYANISIQTIKDRYAKGLDNWGAGNYDEDVLRKEKRYDYLEGRMQDLHKRSLLQHSDYLIDCNRDDDFVMVDRSNYDKMMAQFAHSPFKPIPIFKQGIWGGHWCQDVLGVGKDLKNTAWGVTGFLDWQAVAAKVGGNLFEMPATDLLQYEPKAVLGSKIWHLYGYRCPLHVNFLDTWGGGNLSLQVHPTVAYAHEVFNSHWGHYESYYMLDACDESSVYLGTKEGVVLEDLCHAFDQGQVTGTFDDEKYINHFPMKKHDHVFVPAGTIHSAGKNTLTLEIDMFCFTTFKLWDWGRVDYDGKPRPIHIEHGRNVIQEEFQTAFIKDNMVSKQQEVACGYGWRKERSGTMSYEAPMEVNRYWFSKAIHFDTQGSIVIHVLVEGEEAIIESLDGSFEPMVLHYAEAVFMPAAVGQYMMKPYGKSKNQELAVLEIYMNL